MLTFHRTNVNALLFVYVCVSTGQDKWWAQTFSSNNILSNVWCFIVRHHRPLPLGNTTMNVRTAILTPEILDPKQIIDGNPQVSCLILSDDGHVVRGIWKCTRGTVTDIEQDEMFTVIDGRATVVIENGPTLVLLPGYVGLLTHGAKTTWTIHEDIVKTFQITMKPPNTKSNLWMHEIVTWWKNWIENIWHNYCRHKNSSLRQQSEFDFASGLGLIWFLKLESLSSNLFMCRRSIITYNLPRGNSNTLAWPTLTSTPFFFKVYLKRKPCYTFLLISLTSPSSSFLSEMNIFQSMAKNQWSGLGITRFACNVIHDTSSRTPYSLDLRRGSVTTHIYPLLS